MAGALLLAALVAFMPWVSTMTFLFDDYAVVGVTSTTPLADLVRGSYGFFRPACAVLFRAEAIVFGWSSPWGWALTSAALHGLNALLLAALLVRLGAGAVGAASGAALFAVSPWASEALFWVSAQPDLLAVTGLLAAALAGLASADAHGPRRAVRLAFAFLAGALALLSKEMAVTLPALFLLLAAAASPDGPRAALRRAAPAVAGFAAITLAYLVLRGRVVPGLAGPYGRFEDIARLGSVVPSLAGNMRGMLLPPVFADDALRPLTQAARLAFAALAAGFAALGFRARPRAALALALALALSFAPVIWSVPPPGSTAGGRMRYLPGIFACALFALGAGRVASQARPRTWQAGLASAAFLLGLVSLSTQRRLWSTAATLARQSVAQVAALVPLREPLFVTNLPFALAEGPFILKSYAFRWALGSGSVAGVRANAVTVAVRNGAVIELRAEPDPFSDPAPGRPERSLTLRLSAP